MYKYYFTIITIAFLLASCATNTNNVSKIDLSSGNYECISLKTNNGDIILGLDRINAPESVRNYIDYTNNRFYDGTIFHRVIDGFMIQGGGLDSTFVKKETNAPIVNESNNGLLNTRGSVAAARTSDPHSTTSQFFINTVDNDFLNYKNEASIGYAVFGHVVSGMDVVDSISSVKTGSVDSYKDVPKYKIIIEFADVISCGEVKQ